MAENTANSSGGGSNAGLAFVVGGLLVVVAVIAWFVFAGGGMNPAKKEIDVDVNLPKVEALKLPDAPSPQTN